MQFSRVTRAKADGRDAILQYCIARQKNVVGNIRTRHNMMNIVFDQLTPRRADKNVCPPDVAKI
jgi:hypothetical protein